MPPSTTKREKIRGVTSSTIRPAKKHRDHLESNQQLLKKQADALKNAVAFRKFENRVIGIERKIQSITPSNQLNFSAFDSLLSQAEDDAAGLKLQSSTTRALLSFFSRRHDVQIEQAEKELVEIVEDFIQNLTQLKIQFSKAHGPCLFRKLGSVSRSRYEDWVTRLANIYKKTLVLLHDWHKRQSQLLTCAISEPNQTSNRA